MSDPVRLITLGGTMKIGKNMLVVELSLGQMYEDVKLATGCKCKAHLHGRTAGGLPEQIDIIAHLEKVLAAKGDEIIRNF